MSRLLPLLAVLATTVACYTSPALVAVEQEHIMLKKSAAEVLDAAGPPDLVLARSAVETYYYDRRDGFAVSVSLVDGIVVAFNDSDGWPEAVAEAAGDADTPVSTGNVRVGMTEDELVAAMGVPSGITASDGLESLHWLTGSDVDSVVEVEGGKVVGFWDRPISEYTQNLPTEGAERDNATTGGRIRVGMTQAQVEAALGGPDGRSGDDGVVTHRYESDPLLFGDTIMYSVGYKEGVVVALSEFNESREEAKKEEEEAKRAAAAAEARGEAAESSILSFLANPLVQAAIVGAIGGKKMNVSKTSTKSTATRTLEINGVKYTGGEHLGRQCTLASPCPDGYSCHLVTDSSGMCVQ